MNSYLDTSVIAACYCPEPLSDRAEDFLISHATPGISPLTELELFSALSRKVREESLDAIHLAIASMEDRAIVTADKGLAESAEFFSIDFIFL